MALSTVIFYCFAVLAVLSALGIVFTKNVLYSAFLLIVTFLCVAAVYVFAGAGFIAVTQIMVYAGGILVLMVFGVMLTNKISGQAILTESHNKAIGTLIGVLTFVGLFYGIARVSFASSNWIGTEGTIMANETIKQIGVLLMSSYILPFEIAGILLLVALIGAAIIAKSGKEGADDPA